MAQKRYEHRNPIIRDVHSVIQGNLYVNRKVLTGGGVFVYPPIDEFFYHNYKFMQLESQKPIIESQNQKSWWKEKLKELGLIFVFLVIPAILYLAIRNLSEKYSFMVFIVVLFFCLWLIFDKYQPEIKRLKRQIKILLKHSDYSQERKQEIIDDLKLYERKGTKE